MSGKQFVHPYIPNSEPAVKKAMLDVIGMQSVEDIYKGIPDRLRFKGTMDLPEPMISEYTCQRHVEGLLAKNKKCKRQYLLFRWRNLESLCTVCC